MKIYNYMIFLVMLCCSFIGTANASPSNHLSSDAIVESVYDLICKNEKPETSIALTEEMIAKLNLSEEETAEFLTGTVYVQNNASCGVEVWCFEEDASGQNEYMGYLSSGEYFYVYPSATYGNVTCRDDGTTTAYQDFYGGYDFTLYNTDCAATCSQPTYSYTQTDATCNEAGSVTMYGSGGGTSSYYFAYAGGNWDGPYSNYNFYNLTPGSWTLYISSDPYNSSCQNYLTVQITEDCNPCAGQGGDSDNDGVCNNQDCQPYNAAFPATPGTACNDGNSNTTNDVVTSNGCGCAGTPVDSCAGQGGDSDNDGVCNNEDCQPYNAAFPATPGTPCNDGNSNTTNDVVTSNGCGCAGTPVGTTCSVTTGNCSITITGLSSSDHSKVFNSSWQVIWECSSWSSSCGNTETITGLSDGTYFVQACGSTDSYTVSGCSTNPCAGQGGDSDNDGVCNNEDCQPYNAAFPATPGTPCNDGNSNTTNDVVTSNGCGCAGTPVGTTCSVTTGNCSITITGLSSSDHSKVFNSNWQVIWECSPWSTSCGSTETITGLSDRAYFVQACGSTDSHIVSGCNTPLEAEANDDLYFQAQKDGRDVAIYWVTNTDYKNDYFEVEHSTDGVNFDVMNEVISISDSEDHMNYQDRDADAEPGMNYYRLKQIFNDGTYRYSGVKEVAFDLDINEFVIYPNPTANDVFVNLKDFVGNVGVITIYNSLGQVMHTENLDVISSEPVRISTNNMRSGVHAVSVKIEGKKVMTELLMITKM